MRTRRKEFTRNKDNGPSQGSRLAAGHNKRCVMEKITQAAPVVQNPLAPVVIGLIRALRIEHQAHDSTREVLHAAVAFAAEKDRENDRTRARYLNLLAEFRAMASGRTSAEERQQIDEAAVFKTGALREAA